MSYQHQTLSDEGVTPVGSSSLCFTAVLGNSSLSLAFGFSNLFLNAQEEFQFGQFIEWKNCGLWNQKDLTQILVFSLYGFRLIPNLMELYVVFPSVNGYLQIMCYNKPPQNLMTKNTKHLFISWVSVLAWCFLGLDWTKLTLAHFVSQVHVGEVDSISLERAAQHCRYRERWVVVILQSTSLPYMNKYDNLWGLELLYHL